MGMGSQSSVKFKIIIDLLESDILIQLQINKRPKPCNLSTMSPLVINRVIIRFTSLRRIIFIVNQRTQARIRLNTTQVKRQFADAMGFYKLKQQLFKDRLI